MNAASLPARIAYAMVVVPFGAAAGFYSCMHFLPDFTASYPQLDPGMDGAGIFNIALAAGAAVAFTMSLLALTLPWSRRRKRRGRAGRIGFSCGVVVLSSLIFADLGLGMTYDLAFVAWLTYVMTFTFVRYGLLDQKKRTTPSVEAY